MKTIILPPERTDRFWGSGMVKKKKKKRVNVRKAVSQWFSDKEEYMRRLERE